MMAKPIRALELHYPMIQFLIKPIINWKEIYGNARGQRGRGQKGGFLLDLIVNGGKAIGNLFSTGAKAIGF